MCYDSYRVQISNNPAKSAKLVQQADELEDQMSKEHKDAGAAITMFQPVRADNSYFCC